MKIKNKIIKKSIIVLVMIKKLLYQNHKKFKSSIITTKL